MSYYFLCIQTSDDVDPVPTYFEAVGWFFPLHYATL